MNVNAILFLQASDLTHFSKVQDRYQGVRRLFIDPGLIEVAVREGVELEPFSFVPPDFGLHLQSEVANEASFRAAHLDQALTKLRRDTLGEGLFQGWDQSLLRQFFLRATLFRELGKLCDAQFAPGRIGLLRPDNPQLFYFDSFVATDMFASSSSRWHVIERYDAAALWRSDAYSRIFEPSIMKKVVAKGVDCVTHLPATYRHIAECLPQINARFDGVLDLPSPFWDIPVSRSEDVCRPISDFELREFLISCLTYKERSRFIFEEHLSDFLPHQLDVSIQSRLFAERSFMQAMNFYSLREALEGTRPHFILTDHDTGNNGPLFSVAQHLGSGITVIPHSSYITGVIPHSERVEAVERDGFRTATRTCLGEYVPTRGVRFGREVKRRPRNSIQTVCLLLNGFVSNGLFHLDFMGVTKFFDELRSLCQKNAVKLIVRLKPTASGLGLVSGALGISSEVLEQMLKPSIEEVAEASDLCISFGQPTSAMINFLDAGCFLMHVGRQHWPADSAWAPSFVGDGTVPAFLDDEGLIFIERLLASQKDYHVKLASQSNKFQARLSGGVNIFDDSPAVISSISERRGERSSAESNALNVQKNNVNGVLDLGSMMGGYKPRLAERLEPDPKLWAAALAAIPKSSPGFSVAFHRTVQ